MDAFGIPDELLAAPIGLPGGKASQTSSAEIEEELPNVRELVRELGDELATGTGLSPASAN